MDNGTNNQKRTTQKQQKNGNWKKIGLPLIGVLVIGGVAGGYYWQQDQLKKTNAEIVRAQQLVQFNPLATGKDAKKLKKMLPTVGEKMSMTAIRNNVKDEGLNATKLKALNDGAEKEINAANDKEMVQEKKQLAELKTKVEAAKKDKNFPTEYNDGFTKLFKVANNYMSKNDANGLKVMNFGLNYIADKTTDSIAQTTKEQQEAAAKKKQEEEQKKADATALQDAVKNETYPSLGMLRGDLANGIGVIPMGILPDGPAYNADFGSDDDWSDSSVITSIDGKRVASAVLGDNSMEKVLQGIKMGKKVEVGFLDGSTKEVKLDMTKKDAAKETYPELKNPGSDTDTDLYFGVSGYNIGQKHNNKEIGLVITDIYDDGSASDSDLEKGDIICRIDGYYVGDTTDIDKIMTNYDDGDTVEVDYVDTDGHLQTTDVTLIED